MHIYHDFLLLLFPDMVCVIFRVNTSGIYSLNLPCYLCLKITSFFTSIKTMSSSIYAGLHTFYNPSFLPQFLSYYLPCFFKKKSSVLITVFYPNDSEKNKSAYAC